LGDLFIDNPQQEQNVNKIELSAKEIATANNEPYIAIVDLKINPNDINSGEIKLDWNDKFVLDCIRCGYKIKNDDTDADIVDRWYTQLCKNIVMETYEQAEADLTNRDNRFRDLGGGYSEHS